jgi:tetratricopeptide (TPR) repeat protein
MIDVPDSVRDDAEIAEMLRTEAAGEWEKFRAPRLVALAGRLADLSEVDAALRVLAEAQREAEELASARSWFRRCGVVLRVAVMGSPDPTLVAVDCAARRANILIGQGRPPDAFRVLRGVQARGMKLDQSLRGHLRTVNGHALLAAGLYGRADAELMYALLDFESLPTPIAAWEADARRATARLHLGVRGSQVGPIETFIQLLGAQGEERVALTWAPAVTLARLAASGMEVAERGVADLEAWAGDVSPRERALDSALQILAVGCIVHGRRVDAERYARRSFAGGEPGSAGVPWSGSATSAALLHAAELAWLPPERAAGELCGLESWLDLVRQEAVRSDLVELLRLFLDLEVEHGAASDDARVLQTRAYLHLVDGDYSKAVARLWEALSATRTAGGLGVNVLHDLAVVERRRGNLARAAELLVEAKVHCDPEDSWVLAGVTHELAGVRAELGAVDDALSLYTAVARSHEQDLMPSDAWDARRNAEYLKRGVADGDFVPFRSGGFVMAW